MTAALLAVGPALAAVVEEGTPPEPKPPAKPAVELKGEYGMLAKEAQLDEPQQVKLQERVKAFENALEAWEKDNGEKVRQARDAMRKAREANDAEALKKATETLRPLMEQQEKLRADLWKDINGMLTAEQAQKWAAFKAYRSLMTRLSRAGLTEEQKKQVRGLCDGAGKDLASDDEQVARAALRAIQEKVEGLLTAEQKEALRRPASRPVRESRGSTEAPKAAE